MQTTAIVATGNARYVDRMNEPQTPKPPIGFGQQMSTRVAFFLAGFAMSTWAPLIPFAKSRLHLSDGHLGMLLLCLGAGSVIGMPLAGTLAGRYGCRRVIATAVLGIICALPLLGMAGSTTALALTLLLFGAAVGTLDVVVNIQAVLVERGSGRSMMSGFHGLYSVGGFAGAGSVSLLISIGATPLVATLVSVAITAVLLCVSFRFFLPYGGDRDAPAFVVPHGLVLLLGVFCFALFLAEGSVLDWSAVFLANIRGMHPSHAGLGYVAFSVAMTTCRLAGDAIVHAVGPRRVVLFGTLCAAGGFLLAITVPSAAAGIIGFALVGVGASNVVPVMFSAVGRQTAMPTHLAIAAMTTLGYAGILSGPAAIGFIANATNLRFGLAVVAALLIAVAIGSTRVKVFSPTA